MSHQPQVAFATNDANVDILGSLASEKQVPPGTPPTESTDGDYYEVPSQRSTAYSVASTGSTTSSTAKSPSLRENLTRQHKDRDPNTVYERVKLLGNGSMGSVSLVRKLTLGGSARYNAQERAKVQDKYDECFQLPIIGGLLALIFKAKAQADLAEASRQPHKDAFMVFNSKSTTVTMSTSGSDSSNQTLYAMKSIHYNLIKDQIFVDELKNEIAILKQLDHAHIVRVHETYDFDRQLFVIMEVCTGGDLYTRDPYSEAEAARITAAILGAVSYMHSKNVIHRDLKFENILFANISPTADIKLIDFGLCKEIKEHEHIQEGAGTIYTMAPEVIQGKYSREADLWSVGVIVFMLLSSQMPFFGKKRREVVKKILSGEYECQGRRWKNISNQAKAFVDDLLILDPAERATASQALSASWLHRRQEASVRNPHSRELTHVKQCIQRYVNYPRLRKLAMMLIAHRSTTDEIGILRKVFQHYDTKHDGHLTYEAFKGALHEAGYSDDDYREVFNAVDVDGSGLIRYTEFLAATIEAAGWISEERLAEAFDRVDHDDTGYISKENLRYLLGSGFPDEEIDSIMEEAASDPSRGITYADFLTQWNDDKEEFMRRWREHMVPDVVLDERKSADMADGQADFVSEISFGSMSSSGDRGRSDFMHQKALSERKQRNAAAQSASPE